MPSFPVIINAGGGKGGVGTDGTNGGNGGRGGDAGDGGDGGDGGEVRINYLKNSRILDEVMISVNAGKGGKGGEKGLGGIGLSGGRGGIDGRNGTDGRDGRSGQVRENTVQSPEELFRGVDHRLFKKENLVWTLEVKGKE